jgi:hypothetical protein
LTALPDPISSANRRNAQSNSNTDRDSTDGETADVVILTRPMMDDLQKQNKLAGGLTDFAATPVSVVARAGAPKPDISSVEASSTHS